MNKKLLITSLSILALTISGVSLASAKTGLAIGVSAGFQNYITNLQPSNVNTRIKPNGNFNVNGILGYDYALNNNLSIGLETGVGYTNAIAGGEQGPVNKPEDIESWNENQLQVPVLATVKYYLPVLDNNISVFGKFGYSYVRQQAKSNGTPAMGELVSAANYTKWLPTLAAGLGYNIYNFNVFTEYTYVMGSTPSSNNSIPSNIENGGERSDHTVFSSGAVTVGVTYTFAIN